jgi:hypothetical protein
MLNLLVQYINRRIYDVKLVGAIHKQEDLQD